MFISLNVMPVAVYTAVYMKRQMEYPDFRLVVGEIQNLRVIRIVCLVSPDFMHVIKPMRRNLVMPL